jgi:hypothetical protein
MIENCRNRTVILGLVGLLAVSPLSSARAQTAEVAAPAATATTADETLSNEQVIALIAAGLSEQTIILKIRGSKTSFDTSAAALVRLKEAGATDAVLAAMLSPAAPPQPEAAAAPAAPVYEPGVYLVEGSERVQIEPTVFTNAKSGGGFWTGMTYGIAKAKIKANVPGRAAAVRSAQSRPTFEFYFQGSNGLMFPVAGASTPSEFILVPLAQKNDRRELTVGQIGLYSASAGVKGESILQLEVEKLGPGHYRAAPKGTLKPGEYCFYFQSPSAAGAAGTGGKLFAFGITDSRAVRK